MTGLVLWVCGTILAGSACRNAVAAALSTRGNWNNMQQYLREWLYDGGDRARPCGTELDVSPNPPMDGARTAEGGCGRGVRELQAR